MNWLAILTRRLEEECEIQRVHFIQITVEKQTHLSA